MLISRNLHNKSSEVSVITRSPPASLSFKGQVNKHTTVKRSIKITMTLIQFMKEKTCKKSQEQAGKIMRIGVTSNILKRKKSWIVNQKMLNYIIL